MFSHLTIVSTLLSVAATAISISRGSTVNLLSLGILMPEAAATDISYNLLSALSLSALWFNVLAIIGVKVINGWKASKAIIVGVIAFVLAVAIPVLVQAGAQSFLSNLNLNF
jgi:hypothetical protein